MFYEDTYGADEDDKKTFDDAVVTLLRGDCEWGERDPTSCDGYFSYQIPGDYEEKITRALFESIWTINGGWQWSPASEELTGWALTYAAAGTNDGDNISDVVTSDNLYLIDGSTCDSESAPQFCWIPQAMFDGDYQGSTWTVTADSDAAP